MTIKTSQRFLYSLAAKKSAKKSAEDQFGEGLQRRRRPAHEDRRHPALPPGLEIVADLVLRPDEADLVDHLPGHRRDGLALLAVEEELLDLVDRFLVPESTEHIGVEVHLLGAHAADIQGERRTQGF